LIRDNDGAGTITLSGPNDFSGGFYITSRNLILGGKSALGTGTFTIGDPLNAPANAMTLSSASALTGANAVGNNITVNQNVTLGGINDLEFSGPVTLTMSPTVTVTNTAATILSGAIGGAGFGITKAGNGTLTMSGASTYTGPTTVSAGTLLVNGSLDAGSTVTVNGGTLGGTGTINGAVAVNSGGTLAPGASIGTLTFGSSLTLSGTTTMEINRGAVPNADKIVMSSGTVT